MPICHSTVISPKQNSQGSLTRWWFRKHKRIQLNFILWQGHFDAVSSRNHQLLHNWEGEAQNWKRNRKKSQIRTKIRLGFRICGIKTSYKWLYFVNMPSLNTAAVSGFALIVNAKALIGFYNFKTSPKLLSHLSLQILCSSCSFFLRAETWPSGSVRGKLPPQLQQDRKGFPWQVFGREPSCSLMAQQDKHSTYQTAISDLHKYMKNPRYFFEKLLGDWRDFCKKKCIATTLSMETQNTNLLLLFIFSFQPLLKHFLDILFQISCQGACF